MSVRVLVVDDSRFYRRRVSEILSLDSNLEVVGTAQNGAEAVELTKSLRPDVVTMDVEMPVMDGITATRQIMESNPTPILMFSSLTATGARATLDALDAGAVDYVPKNFNNRNGTQDKAIATLCRRIFQLKELKARFESKSSPAIVNSHIANRPKAFNVRNYCVLVIGTSTGGPIALQSILSRLPEEFPIPIVLVQHMPGTFTPAFAKRLDQLCHIRVKEAAQGEVLKAGTAYLAPGEHQTSIIGSARIMSFWIEPAKVGQIYKPCIDVTFNSLAKLSTDRILAIILTGMGKDGMEGAKSLKRLGATIWVQDADSAMVSSMPMSVANAGVADQILSLNEIGSVLAGSR